MKISLMASTAALALFTAGAALADCGIAAGSVRILSNDFAALHTVNDRALECATDAVEVTTNATTEHKNIQVAALTTDPAAYTVAVVANGSLVPLLNESLVRPLDDLVAQYGQQLSPSQLISIDGQIVAIAFMANTQHLHYRGDLFEANGIAAPTSYEDLIAAAEVLRANGVSENALFLNLKPGWDLGEEFVNMYMGFGAEFFEAGSAVPAIQGEAGIKTLEMMAALTEYMGPEFMTFNTEEALPLWQASEIAVMNQWGSRAAVTIDPAGAAPEVAAATVLAAAPTVGGGTIPATTLWWDGFVISKNISDEDAAASFQAMMHAISPDLLIDHSAEAAWLIDGYVPTPAAVGVFETVAAGAKPYPMVPYMGLLHTALGDNLAEFLQGQESAEQALADAVAAYTVAATEAGFIQ